MRSKFICFVFVFIRINISAALINCFGLKNVGIIGLTYAEEKLHVEELDNVNADGTIEKAPVASVAGSGSSLSQITSTTSANVYTLSQLFAFVKQNEKNSSPKYNH